MRLAPILALTAALLLAPKALADDTPGTSSAAIHAQRDPAPSPDRGVMPVENLNTNVEYATLQGAIDDASPGDNIRVKHFTLNEVDVSVDKPITIIGQGSGQSIIDAGSAGRCMNIFEADPVRIVGMTFRNGVVNGEPGGGVRIAGANVVFEGCLFLGCGSPNDPGGAMSLLSADVTIDSSLLLQNFARFDSLATFQGGGASSLTISNCEITDNTTLDGPQAMIGFHAAPSTLEMINCTLARNGTPGDPAQPLISAGPADFVAIANTIIWDNEGVPFDVPNLDVFASIYPGAVGPDNFDTDPMFRDPAGFDFRLAPGSPAIDAAFANFLADIDPVTQLVTSYKTADALGEPRYFDDPRTPDTGAGFFGPNGFNTGAPFLGTPDIGAHEFRGGQCAADLALPFGLLDFSDVFQFLIDFGAGCP